MSSSVPDVGMVVPKPVGPLPTGPGWDVLTDQETERLWAQVEAVKAKEQRCKEEEDHKRELTRQERERKWAEQDHEAMCKHAKIDNEMAKRTKAENMLIDA